MKFKVGDYVRGNTPETIGVQGVVAEIKLCDSGCGKFEFSFDSVRFFYHVDNFERAQRLWETTASNYSGHYTWTIWEVIGEPHSLSNLVECRDGSYILTQYDMSWESNSTIEVDLFPGQVLITTPEVNK